MAASALALQLVRFYLVFKCVTALPIDSNDFDKVNRDMEKPFSPPKEDSRPQTGNIIQAHDVLRTSLNSFYDWKDTNLTLCLDKLRKRRDPYLDELGRVITGYKTIFELVLKQVEEVSNNNYAVGQFDNDRHDLCSIARYLSHQESFSDRQNIISKMGDALGSECDPCIRYKRKNFNEFWNIDIASEIEAEEKCKQKGNPPASATTSSTLIPTSTEKLVTSSTSSSTRPTLNFISPTLTTSISDPASIISLEMTNTLLEKLCNRQSVDVRLRNLETKEFLYSEKDEFAVDNERRSVFTWKDLKDIPGQSGSNWAGEELWRFEPVDQCASSSSQVSVFVRNIAPNRPSKEYLYADSSEFPVHLRRGLQDSDNTGLTALGASAKWHMMAKVVDGYRGDVCELGYTNIKGFVLRNERHGTGYLNGDDDYVFEQDSEKRRKVYLSKDISAWEIFPDLSAIIT